MSEFTPQIVTAHSGGWLDDAAEGLEQSSVYVAGDVPEAIALQETLAQVVRADGKIAVVVLPKDAVLESQYSTYLLDELFDASGYDTLILAVGEDLQANSNAIDGDEAMRIANRAERDSGGDMQAALTETVQQISAASPLPGNSPLEQAQDPGAGAMLVPVIVAVVALAAAGTAITAVIRSRRRVRSDALPATIRTRLTRLRAVAPLYTARGAAGDRIASRAAVDIGTLIDNVQQLFGRVNARADPGQRAIAEAEYADKLGRLVAALEGDYLLDLLTNPRLWEESDKRIREVIDALDAVSAQLLDNIRQVNARKGLHFQVALDSLVDRKELRDWEREFKRTSER